MTKLTKPRPTQKYFNYLTYNKKYRGASHIQTLSGDKIKQFTIKIKQTNEQNESVCQTKEPQQNKVKQEVFPWRHAVTQLSFKKIKTFIQNILIFDLRR